MQRRYPGSVETGRGTIGRSLAALRPFILGAILLGIWPTVDPALVEPVGMLAMAPERIDEHFTRCGRGRGHACVIDGDTIKLGQRKIRIIGIHARSQPPAMPRGSAAGRIGNSQVASPA